MFSWKKKTEREEEERKNEEIRELKKKNEALAKEVAEIHEKIANLPRSLAAETQQQPQPLHLYHQKPVTPTSWTYPNQNAGQPSQSFAKLLSCPPIQPLFPLGPQMEQQISSGPQMQQQIPSGPYVQDRTFSSTHMQQQIPSGNNLQHQVPPVNFKPKVHLPVSVPAYQHSKPSVPAYQHSKPSVPAYQHSKPSVHEINQHEHHFASRGQGRKPSNSDKNFNFPRNVLDSSQPNVYRGRGKYWRGFHPNDRHFENAKPQDNRTQENSNEIRRGINRGGRGRFKHNYSNNANARSARRPNKQFGHSNSQTSRHKEQNKSTKNSDQEESSDEESFQGSCENTLDVLKNATKSEEQPSTSKGPTATPRLKGYCLSKKNLGPNDVLLNFIGSGITLLDAIALNVDLTTRVRDIVMMSDPDVKDPTLESPKTLVDIVNFKTKFPNAKIMLL